MIAVICGGGAGVWKEMDEALALIGSVNGLEPVLLGINEAGIDLEGMEHWCSLHPERWEPWIRARQEKGLHDSYLRWSLSKGAGNVDRTVRTKTMRGGSSGLFAVDVALNGLGLPGAILCGVPLDARANAFTGRTWEACGEFRPAWQRGQPELERTRSMAGFTRELLGHPTREWLVGLR